MTDDVQHSEQEPSTDGFEEGLIQHWVSASVSEWRRRTWYGKMWYPFWFFTMVCAWLVIGIPLFVGVYVYLTLKEHASGVKPSVYKEGQKPDNGLREYDP